MHYLLLMKQHEEEDDNAQHVLKSQTPNLYFVMLLQLNREYRQ